MSENPGGIFVAKETFATVIDGQRVTVKKGVTRVRAGHALLTGREHLFRPVEDGVRFDVETARAEPVVPTPAPEPAAPPAPKPAKKAASSASPDKE